MAQLKDSLITGDLRVTGTIYGLGSNLTNIDAGNITSGTLPVSRGGTGATTFTSGALLIGNGTNAVSTRSIKNMTAAGNLGWTSATTNIDIPTVNTLAYWNGRYNDSTSNLAYCNKGAFGNAATYGVDDATANGALGTGTGLTTERSVYYGLVTVNNASQTRATGIYAPTSAGTANQILVSAGGTSAPTWKATANGAAYATSANGALTFGTLPVAQGGTGATTFTSGNVLVGSGTNAVTTIAKTSANTANTLVQRDGSGNFSAGTITATSFDGDLKANDVIPSILKTYTNTAFYSTNDSWDNSTWYFMSAKPDAWRRPWRVRFKIRSFCPAYTNGDSVSWVELYGRDTSVSSYKIFNEFYERGHYYIAAYPLKQAGFNGGYGVAIGVSIRYAWNYTNSAYYRTFVVDYYDCDNCTVTMLDAPVKWASWTGTGTTNYGSLQTFNACDRGLQEYGDANSYDLLQMSSNYLKNGAEFRMPPNSLFGFDRAGNAQALSLYSSGYTSSTTGVNTARVYNTTTGIDWTRGIWYKAEGTNYAASADLNISIRSAASAVDLRYSDNCVASGSATTLGMVNRKPVFIRGIIKEDGLFYVRPLSVTYNSATYQRAWTQDLPTSVQKDGNYQYVYWFVGYPYYDSSYAASLYRINLQENNKMYWYNDGKFEEYSTAPTTALNVYYNENTQTLHLDYVSNNEITTLSQTVSSLVNLHANNNGTLKTVAQEIADNGGTITENTLLNINGVQFRIQNA